MANTSWVFYSNQIYFSPQNATWNFIFLTGNRPRLIPRKEPTYSRILHYLFLRAREVATLPWSLSKTRMKNWVLCADKIELFSMYLFMDAKIWVPLLNERSLLAYLLYRGVRPLTTDECPGLDIKPSDGEAPVLELWWIESSPSFSLLPAPFWPGVVHIY